MVSGLLSGKFTELVIHGAYRDKLMFVRLWTKMFGLFFKKSEKWGLGGSKGYFFTGIILG